MLPWLAPLGTRALAASALVGALCAGCSADPIRDLKRQAAGMRPRLLETCLPEASAVQIDGDVERLTYAWNLDEPGVDLGGAGELDSVGSFQGTSPAGAVGACKVIVEIDSGVVRDVEIGEVEPTPADLACAARVRACLAAPKSSDTR